MYVPGRANVWVMVDGDVRLTSSPVPSPKFIEAVDRSARPALWLRPPVKVAVLASMSPALLRVMLPESVRPGTVAV